MDSFIFKWCFSFFNHSNTGGLIHPASIFSALPPSFNKLISNEIRYIFCICIYFCFCGIKEQSASYEWGGDRDSESTIKLNNRSWWRSPQWMWMNESTVSSSAVHPSCKSFFHNYTHVPGSRDSCRSNLISAKWLILIGQYPNFLLNSSCFPPPAPLTQIRPRSQVKCHWH